MIKVTVQEINNIKTLSMSVEGLEITPAMVVSLDEEECDVAARQLVEAACDLLRKGKNDMSNLSLEVFNDALSIPEVCMLYRMMGQ